MGGISLFELSPTNQFKRDVKNNLSVLLSDDWITVSYHLINGLTLPEKYRDHALIGNWKGFRECHIKPDLLLIYEKQDHIIQLVRLGSHAELFG